MPRILTRENLLPMIEAQNILLSSFPCKMMTRTIPVSKATGHVLAKPVLSQRTMPPLMLVVPDGIAVKSNETKDASKNNPLEINAIRVNTGLPLPDGYDAVIRIEDVQVVDRDRYIITSPVSAKQMTIPKGGDVIEGQVLMPTDHYLTPYDTAILPNYGIREVTVRSWKVGLFATGDEVIPTSKEPIPGQIVDTNTSLISQYLREYGVLTEIYPIVPDNLEMLTSRLRSASEICDLVIFFGGSAAGSKDFAVDAIENAGELLFHGIGMVPGKPTSCGKIQGIPVIGLPGPTIGSLIAFNQLIQPLLKSWGVPVPSKKKISGELTEPYTPFDKMDTFKWVKVSQDGEKTYISPVERRHGPSMGILADAIFHIPRNSDEFKKGDIVEVELIRDI